MKKSQLEKATVQFNFRTSVAKTFVDLYGQNMYEVGGNNGAVGATTETVLKAFGSTSVVCSPAGKPDCVGYIPDSPRSNRHHGKNSIIEYKTGGADVSKLYQDYLNGTLKADYVVYWLRKPYTKHKGDPVDPCLPIICDATVFFDALTELALRKDKSNGNGKWVEKTGQKVKPYAIQPGKKVWAQWVESQTVFSPLHRYTYDEIVNHTESLEQYDFDAIYTFFDIMGV